MKKYLSTIAVLSCLLVNAQTNIQQTDTVTFTVHGVCEECEHRIEEAAKGRGVISADWNVDSKKLQLIYNPSKTTINKVENRILGVGHDVEGKRAKDVVYNELDACCRYRELEQKTMSMTDIMDTAYNQKDSHLPDSSEIDPGHHEAEHTIKGVVLESNDKGNFHPLIGATITWLNTTSAAITDSNGVFNLPHDGKSSRLVVSYSGYQTDTISVSDFNELKIILSSNQQLKEVVVTSKLRSSYLSALNPVRTQVMTDRELLKAACCNLSESFETNPSVDVSYNDAITGSKQIQLLGLSGNYTQLTVENLPGPRGIATPLGLNSIAGPWIESIQLTKGIGSVVNGYESIAGQINVELKMPENSERLFANAYVNEMGKTDLNLNLATNIGKKWSTGLLLHDDFLTNKQVDFNNDGFRDLPTGNQFSLVNKWSYENGKGLVTHFGIKVLNDDRTGGELDYDADLHKNTTEKYGLAINTKRYEAFGKIGYVFPQQVYKSFGLQLAAIRHDQDSYFGLTDYTGLQNSFYANFIYQSIIGTTAHKFRTGLSFAYDNYDERFKAANYKRKEIVPGIFIEYTFTPSDKLSIVGGLRADDNNLFGAFVTPRIHVRYEPIKGSVFRLSAGRGQRTANIFAENTSVFVSSRQVEILNAGSGNAYGLNPEIAWNKGISFDQSFRLFERNAMLSIDYFRNDFKDQVVVDLEDVRKVRFYNLEGKSYSNSVQLETSFEPIRKLEVRLAYRFYDVKTSYENQLLQRPLVAKDRSFANLAYSVSGWKFDYTFNYIGRKRIPSTAGNPQQYQKDELSPAYVMMNAQVSKTFGKKHPMDFYIGAENLTNYFQKDAIIAANDPFSPYFDASLVWGQVTGRTIYAGWRLRIK